MAVNSTDLPLKNKGGRKKGCVPWNKGVPRTEEDKLKMSQAQKGILRRGALDNLRKGWGWNKGKHLSLELRIKISESAKKRVGNKNPNWKGDDVGYSGVHMWIKSELGFPNTCEKCGKTGLKGRQIHWSNRDHKYKRSVGDWQRLCSKCHGEYDSKLNEL